MNAPTEQHTYESGFYLCMEAQASGQATTPDQAIAAWRKHANVQHVTLRGTLGAQAAKFFNGWMAAR